MGTPDGGSSDLPLWILPIRYDSPFVCMSPLVFTLDSPHQIASKTLLRVALTAGRSLNIGDRFEWHQRRVTPGKSPYEAIPSIPTRRICPPLPQERRSPNSRLRTL